MGASTALLWQAALRTEVVNIGVIADPQCRTNRIKLATGEAMWQVVAA
jgi:hypothetical protein